MEANLVLDSPIIKNEGLSINIPRYIFIGNRVIKVLTEGMDLENLMQPLNSDNRNKHHIALLNTDGVRLQMRAKVKIEETE
jgi:hypothetical protein